MDCPHCRAPQGEGAAACPSCGVDLIKFKARQALAELKRRSPGPSETPPWARSAAFLGALGAALCLLLYGSALLLGRSARRPEAVAAPPAASAAPAAAASAEPAAGPEGVPAPPSSPLPSAPALPDSPAVPAEPPLLVPREDGTWDASAVPLPPPPPSR